MLAKIKTITNLGSVIISVALVAIQVIDLVNNKMLSDETNDIKTGES